MSFKIKTVVFILKLLSSLILSRSFGSIIFDISNKYNGNVSIAQLRKLEKSYIKLKKAELDVTFLQNCQLYGVYPKFLCYNLPSCNSFDARAIRKRLLRSAIHKRNKEKHKLEKECTKARSDIHCIVSGIDYYIIEKSVQRNVEEFVNKTLLAHERKLRNLTNNAIVPFTKDEVISNLSTYTLSNDESDLLTNGLNYAIPPSRISKTDVFTSFEMISKFATTKLKKEELAGELKSELSYLANNYHSNYRPSKETLRKHGILKKLRKNENIVICKPDKGNGVVIIDRLIYVTKMLELLNDPSKFQKLEVDPTLRREGQLQRFLRNLKGNKLFDKYSYEKVYPSGSQCGRLYGLPKLHKVSFQGQTPPFRPVVSSIGTYNYQLAKMLSDLLTPLLPTDHCTTDTFSFVEDLKKVRNSGKFMISFDVESLFTNIPLSETIELAVELMTERLDLGITKPQLRKLFVFATKQSHFSFNNSIYDQTDGVAMGSPLAPALANLFLGHHESIWLKDPKAEKVLFYRRYVDDIFCLFESENDYEGFFEFINERHPNIRFTYEKENNQMISFLDVLITNTPTSFDMTTFYKKTYTGLLTNFTSFTPFKYKVGLIRTLLDRAFKINSTYTSLHTNFSKIKGILQKNSFPTYLVDKHIKECLDDKLMLISTEKPNSELPRFYKLPYIGEYSNHVSRRIKKLVSKFCVKDTRIQIIFTPFKIASCFSLKDRPLFSLKANVVYKFDCASCNASYVGETSRHLSVRINEHLQKDKSSHIYKHLNASQACKDLCSNDCFSILDTATSKYQLKIKEGMYIDWLKPSLNKQVHCLKISLLI